MMTAMNKVASDLAHEEWHYETPCMLFYERTSHLRAVSRELTNQWKPNFVVDLAEEENLADRPYARTVGDLSLEDSDARAYVGNIPILDSDLKRLRIPPRDAPLMNGPDYYMNDSIINAYLRLVQDRSELNPMLPSVLCVDSFFYSRLSIGKPYRTSVDGQDDAKMDIFAPQIVFFPINLESFVHWTLVVFRPHLTRDDRRNGNHSLTYYDSLPGTGEASVDPEVKANMESYINVKYYEKFQRRSPEAIEMRAPSSEIPQQRDLVNCGVFSCKYVDILSRDSLLPLVFSKAEIDEMRDSIKEALVSGFVPSS
jgi:Ulp1 family protease